MHKIKLSHTALALGALSVFQGCVAGALYDADTNAAVPAVNVVAVGACLGQGCTNPTLATQKSDAKGYYVFDGYGDYAGGASKIQIVGPATGKDALQLSYYPTDGHVSQVVYLHPTYNDYTDSNTGKVYKFAAVPALYLCKTGALDTDKDGICDAAEVRYGTDPKSADSDGDGFNDPDELFGMQSTGVDLRYLGASATHKDIFVYVDYYFAPLPAALTQVTQAFAASPNTNWDKTTGINLHILMGKQLTGTAPTFYAGVANQPYWTTAFNAIKDANMPAQLASVAHYVLFGGTVMASYGAISGIAKGIPAHDAIVSVPTNATQAQQAGTFMHELGHTLGLGHGGSDSINLKPNYLSVMSYAYQASGLFKKGSDGVWRDGVLDYSRTQIGAVAETSLDEVNGMGLLGLGTTTKAVLSNYRMKASQSWWPVTPLQGTCGGPLDWNRNGTAGDAGLQMLDLDSSGAFDVFPASQNDWDHLVYTGHQDGGGVIGSLSYLKSYTPQLQSVSDPVNELVIQ